MNILLGTNAYGTIPKASTIHPKELAEYNETKFFYEFPMMGRTLQTWKQDSGSCPHNIEPEGIQITKRRRVREDFIGKRPKPKQHHNGSRNVENTILETYTNL